MWWGNSRKCKGGGNPGFVKVGKFQGICSGANLGHVWWDIWDTCSGTSRTILVMGHIRCKEINHVYDYHYISEDGETKKNN